MLSHDERKVLERALINEPPGPLFASAMVAKAHNAITAVLSGKACAHDTRYKLTNAAGYEYTECQRCGDKQPHYPS